MLTKIRMKLDKFTLGEIGIIFLVCTVLYLANRVTLAAGDSVPNSLLAFNLLENHTLHLDVLEKSYLASVIPSGIPSIPFGFVRSANGHLASIYPIGVAILTFPLYIIFYLYLKLIHVSIDLTAESFELYRGGFEKLAATLETTISVVVFYLASRIKFQKSVSLISTFIFAFATNTWVISSQGLWQHGSSNLALVCTIFCLLKANHLSSSSRQVLLILAGFFCGLFPGIRPTSVLFLIANLLYTIFTYRHQSVFFLIGLASIIPSFAYNFYYFGNLVGGYSTLSPISLYLFSFEQFKVGFWGTLVSPSRGLLVFSPILIYAYLGIYNIFKFSSNKDEKLLGCMTIASAVLFINYCFYIFWWGGHNYGPRFMTDILPVVCYLINYFLVYFVAKNSRTRWKLTRNSLIFTSILLFSTMTQVAGAFGTSAIHWHTIPVDVQVHQNRLWDLRDSQIERHTKAVFYKVFKPPVKRKKYIKRLRGRIRTVKNEANQPLTSPISVTPGSTMTLTAELENTGKSKWFGYESALAVGEVRVRSLFYNSSNQLIKDEGRLYVSGTPGKHQTTIAVGSITFPKELGTYTLVFDLIAEGVSEFPKRAGQLPYKLDVKVEQ